jgi:glutathione synthase/RimK-type ligase-like ATP-grasp enzyme
MKETRKYADTLLLKLDSYESKLNTLGADLDGICSMARDPISLSLLYSFEILGAPVINSTPSVRMCLDTLSVLTFLKRSGFPVLLESVHRKSFDTLQFPTILKNVTNHSIKVRSTIVLHSPNDVAKFNKLLRKGLWVAQHYLTNASNIVKAYVVGEEVISIKPEKNILHNDCQKVILPISDIQELSIKCGLLMNLKIYNIEFLIENNNKAWVIDVNDFPSFSNVPNAPRIIAKYLRQEFKR